MPATPVIHRFIPAPPLRGILLAGCCAWVSTLLPAAGHGDYHDVVARIREELRADGANAALRYRLAEAHAGHEEWRECVKELKRVDRLAPGAHPTGYLRGFALHGAGRDSAALEELDAFLAREPGHGDALATRGRVLVRLGRRDEAVRDLQRAFDLARSPNPDLTTDLAACLASRGDDRQASAVIDGGLRRTGDTPALLLRALEIETNAGRWDDALGRIGALERLAPSPAPWMAKRALLLETAGRPAASRAAWISLRDHLLALPSLRRGAPENSRLLRQARLALGEPAPSAVVAPPAS